MKKLMISIIIILLSARIYAQLGDTYNKIASELSAINKKFEKIENEESYCVIVYETSKLQVATYYYFRYQTNVCYLHVGAFKLSATDGLVELMNKRYVKEGINLWKETDTKIFHEISKDDDLVYLKRYY